MTFFKQRMQKTHRTDRIEVSASKFHTLKLEGKGMVENWQALAKAWIATERPDPAHSSNLYTPIEPKPSPPSAPPASPDEVKSILAQFRASIGACPPQEPP